MKLGNAVLQAHVHFRRGADEPQLAGELEEEHVRGGVGHAQCPVDGEGVRLGAPRQPLAEHDLKDVSRGDVFLGLPDHGLERVLSHVGLPFLGRRDLGGKSVFDGLLEPVHNVLNAGDRGRVGGGGVTVQVGIGQDEELVFDVVEDDERVREHPHAVGELQVVAGGGGQSFHKAHQVVPEVAHQAPGEARQAIYPDGPPAFQGFAQDIQWIAGMYCVQ